MMSCFTDFITIDRSTPSESGIYVVDLPGVTVAQLDGLTKEDQADFDELFENIYSLAQTNLKIDLQKKLAQRFHIDKKLVSRETSAFLDEANSAGGLAGVKITFNLPKYARINILSIGVKSNSDAISPEAQFFIYDTDEDGELLSTVTGEISAGRNTIKVYEEFEVDNLFVAYNTDTFDLQKTENKYYADGRYNLEDFSCTFPCYFGQSVGVQQINSGGLNVKFIVTCSMDKFVCENLPLFQYALWYRIGVDLMKERIVSDRVTRFTVIAEERATELMTVFNEEYQNALEAATMNIKMDEDPICFLCKRTITSVTSLP
jgi:hypothetical protein